MTDTTLKNLEVIRITTGRVPGVPGRQVIARVFYAVRGTWKHHPTHKNGVVWFWKKGKIIAHARTAGALKSHRPELKTVGTGGIQKKPLAWTDVRAMTLPWAWASENVSALIDGMDRGEKCGPILADALQDAGFPEQCPVLEILRTMP